MTKQYGLTLFGATRVFRKDKEISGKNKKTFTISDVWFNISEKEDDGSYFNRTQNLLFKKGLELPENNKVIQLSGFPVITGNGDYRKIAYMITEWEPVNE